jgi:hypothetical protein
MSSALTAPSVGSMEDRELELRLLYYVGHSAARLWVMRRPTADT